MDDRFPAPLKETAPQAVLCTPKVNQRFSFLFQLFRGGVFHRHPPHLASLGVIFPPSRAIASLYSYLGYLEKRPVPMRMGVQIPQVGN